MLESRRMNQGLFRTLSTSLRGVLLSVCLLAVLPSFALADLAPAPWATNRSRAEDLTISLVTIDVGKELARWFGHSALVVQDRRFHISRSYNYGVYPNEAIVNRFIVGDLVFFVEERAFSSLIKAYRTQQRSVRIAELDLAADKRLALAKMLALNVRPENAFYLYHQYRDNCATRLRDAIDAAVGGQLSKTFMAQRAKLTMREQTRRYLQRNMWLDAIWHTWVNGSVDGPTIVWQEMALPLALEKQLSTFHYDDPARGKVRLIKHTETLHKGASIHIPTKPRSQQGLFLALGLASSIVGLALCFWYTRSTSQIALRSLGVYHILLGLGPGLMGLSLTLLQVSNHDVTWRNHNLLLLGIPTFLALPFGFSMIRGQVRAIVWTMWCWRIMTVGSLVALLVKVLPVVEQENGAIIAMMLPLNTTLAYGMQRAWQRAKQLHLEPHALQVAQIADRTNSE